MQWKGAVYEWSLIIDLDVWHGMGDVLASTGKMVDAGGTPVKIYPAPAGEPQNALPLPLLPRDFIKKMIPIPRESRGILPLPLPCNTLVPTHNSVDLMAEFMHESYCIL